MIMSIASSAENRVRTARTAKGWSQQELADRAGLARASVSAIETDRLSPSVDAALAIAAALGLSVEALFGQERAALDAPAWAWPVATDDKRYWQAEVGSRALRYPVEATPLGALPHDGVVRGSRFAVSREAKPTLVIATCDPVVGLLASELSRSAGVRVLAFCRSSREALALLKQGLVHLAGCHLGPAGREGNYAAVKEQLGEGYSLVRYADWEEGVATASRERRSLNSLVKSKPRWVARENGSAARQCLNELLGDGTPHRRVARDHRGVAEAIRSGWADAGVCLRVAAAEAGLGFMPYRNEAYDLAFRSDMASDPRIVALLQVLRSPAFAEMLDATPGYRAKWAGKAASIG
jgi:putative molybdopterin biosynthesis protein